MNRRDFIKYLLATPIAAELDIEKLLWIPEKTIFIPSLRQLDFFGIPYHENNATSGVWMGIPRYEIYPEIVELIKALQEDKEKNSWKSL